MNTDIKKEFLAKYIVPNFYKPEHFEKMEDWNQEKIEKFKNYMIKQICYHDAIREIVEEYIQHFEEEEEEESTNFCCRCENFVKEDVGIAQYCNKCSDAVIKELEQEEENFICGRINKYGEKCEEKCFNGYEYCGECQEIECGMYNEEEGGFCCGYEF